MEEGLSAVQPGLDQARMPRLMKTSVGGHSSRRLLAVLPIDRQDPHRSSTVTYRGNLNLVVKVDFQLGYFINTPVAVAGH